MLLHETLRDLLVADLAVEEGLATPEDVADLLASQWKERGSGGTAMRLLEALAASADLEIGDVLRLSAQADRLIAQASGSPGAALSRRHGGARSLHAALVSRVPELTKAFEAAGAAAPSALREMEAGRYTDLTPVGEGGMGTVYRAHDADLDRPVALKVVRADVAGPDVASRTLAEEVVGRFLREARLTGRLEHPGIVPVHEVGRTGAGLPYYAMRLVRNSRTLAEAIGLARGLEARLGLLEPFLKVCDTVAYAHGQGVIHRDLKPQNVALGEYGEVVVLDWGLAKALDAPEPRSTAPRAGAWSTVDASAGERTPSDAFLTQGGILGTVGYLAPEGLSEDDRVDAPTSDVFSLGVILYEILAGRLPWPFPDLYRYAVALQQDAPDPITLEPLVPEGLAAIARKAIARAPGERFATAADLATAVRSWQTATAASREHEARAKEAAAVLAQAQSLQGEPALRQVERLNAVLGPLLAARPDHPEALALAAASERVRSQALEQRDRAARRKTLRRTGALSLVALALGAVAFSTVLQQRNRDLKVATDRAVQAQGESEASKRRAQAERAEAEQVLEFLVYPLRDALGPAGHTDILLDAARRSVEYYEKLPAASLASGSVDRYHSALLNLGNVLVDVGDTKGARQAYDKALAVADRLRADSPTATRPLTKWIATSRSLAKIEEEERDLPAALARDEKVLEVVRARAAAAPGDAALRRALADVQSDRAGRLLRVARPAEAAERLREALGIRRGLVEQGGGPDDEAAIPGTLVDLAECLAAQGNHRAALAKLREARELGEARLRAAPRDLGRMAALASCLERTSLLHAARKEHERALPLSEQALALRREVADRDPTNAAWQSAYVQSCTECGVVLDASGDGEAAERLLSEAVAMQQGNVRLHPQHLGHRVTLAVAQHKLSRALKSQRRFVEALAHGKTAYDLVRSLPQGARERSESLLALSDDVADLESLVSFGQPPDDVRRRAVAKDAIVRAKNSTASGDLAIAHRNWIVALREPSVREDLAAGYMVQAAIVAAQSAATLDPGPERDALESLATRWIVDDLVRRRSALGAEGTDAEVAVRRLAFDAHVARIRSGEPALAPLRARPGFARDVEAAIRGSGS